MLGSNCSHYKTKLSRQPVLCLSICDVRVDYSVDLDFVSVLQFFEVKPIILLCFPVFDIKLTV